MLRRLADGRCYPLGHCETYQGALRLARRFRRPEIIIWERDQDYPWTTIRETIIRPRIGL